MNNALCIPTTPAVLALAKATILFKASMGHGYTTIQARDVSVHVESYAQYDAAVYCVFTPKGKRSPRAIVGTFMPTLIILDGWVDPQAPGEYHAPQDGAAPGVTTQKGRHLSCSPAWTAEAVAAAKATGKIVADYHDHDAKDRYRARAA